jgi:glutamate-5-semialdehyde dehydrogenase
MTLSTAELRTSSLEKLQRAKKAARDMARLSTDKKNAVLRSMAVLIAQNQEKILAANQMDLAATSLRPSIRDRLLLNPERMSVMAKGLQAVIGLPDPIGQVVQEWIRPNGLRIRKVRVPLGVVGVIYESRPNVTVDATVVALKAGNAVVLRGGHEAAHTNEALVESLVQASDLPAGAVELLDSRSRDSVAELMGARGLVDVLIPRGGSDLINHVVEAATVPAIETGAGNCHVYVDKAADLEMADRIVVNAKTQRPSVCNAAEKLLVHRDLAGAYLPRILQRLRLKGVEIHGDEETRRLSPGLHVLPASEEDWRMEYLDLRIAVRVVGSLQEAINHINRYSTMHSDAIITCDEESAREFLDQVDSSAVYWNASTRFTDGGEFGFGVEMGISTQKLHCRGPFGLVELTSTKYQVLGSGQVRT